ncbi:MAG TPA: hypothetical protein VN922_19445 [Bacteroidia bacterium]|nr:hypothetical protein [Bacteroidia bacterium]
MSKIIELAKKLKALAERGVGGEKVNAEKMLQDLLKKHNITLDVIEGDVINDYYVNLTKTYPDNIAFLSQIVRHVNHDIPMYGPFPKKEIKIMGLKGNYLISCTVVEYIEINAKLEFYKRLFNEEIKIFFEAFVKANNIYSSEAPRSASELSPEEYERWKRSSKLAENIKKESFNKQISA